MKLFVDNMCYKKETLVEINHSFEIKNITLDEKNNKIKQLNKSLSMLLKEILCVDGSITKSTNMDDIAFIEKYKKLIFPEKERYYNIYYLSIIYYILSFYTSIDLK